MEPLPTGVVTFLFTDIEGSTRLWEEHPEEMKQALTRHDEILRECIRDHTGYVFSTAGDAFAAAFRTPIEAADAALDAQRHLAVEAAGALGISVRMAIHVGQAHERDGDYFGPTVNRAARILGVGNGGQVLVSQPASELLIARMPSGMSLADLGEHQLKDLNQPERIYQLHHPDLEPNTRPLRSLNASRHNLPLQLTSFVGREDRLRQVTQLIGDDRLVTLTGVGGSGKTRLAIQAAAELVETFDDGVWLVELAPLADEALLPQAVASALDFSGLEGNSLQSLQQFLAHRRLLLVLDNCEHLLDGAAELVERLLTAAPGLHILATSREGLAIAGERLVQVPSMATGSRLAGPTDWEELAQAEAIQLFAERASSVQPDFELTAESVKAVVDICRRVDGMPLAIELAAARTRHLTVDQIAQRLGDRFRLLTGGSRTALPRQQTLLATVEWSYDLLDASERKLFDRLAAFRGGFDLEAAEAVCAFGDLAVDDVLDLLGHLVDKSLVVATAESEGATRFHMLETLRLFTLGKLNESGDADVTRAGHARHFSSLARAAAPMLETPEMATWLRIVEREHDNLRAALDWMLESGDSSSAMSTITDLSVWFWFIRRHHEEAYSWHERSLAQRRGSPPDLVATALAKASMHAARTERDEQAAELAEEALDLSRQTGAETAEIISLWTLGDVAQRRYEPDGHERFGEALEAAEKAEDRVWICRLCQFLAWSADGAGRTDDARRYNARAIGAGQASGWPMGLAEALGHGAELALADGDLDRAAEINARYVAIEDELGDPRNVAQARSLASTIAYQRGDYAEAIGQAESGLAYARRHGDPLAQVFPLSALAVALLEKGEQPEAARMVAGALRLLRDLPYRVASASTLATAAQVLSAAGDHRSVAAALGRVRTVTNETRQKLRPWIQSSADRCMKAAQDNMSPGDFEAAWNAGAGMDLPAAIDRALEALDAITIGG
jgi:predicted ATPase/class 3 adenylate cyclase